MQFTLLFNYVNFFHKEELLVTTQEIYGRISSNRIKTLDNHDTWLIDIRDFYEYLSDIKGYLSKEEIKRSNEISIEKNKDLFCLRKGITRIILSSFFSMDTEELEYAYSIHGKPFVSSSNCENTSFNISHSKEYLVVAIAKKAEVGVDIERINTAFNYSILVESVFSNEERYTFNHYDQLKQLRSFYKVWVQKEAISKALGLGISIGFNKFSVKIDPSISDEEYSIYLEELKHSVKVRTRFKKDYFLAAALV